MKCPLCDHDKVRAVDSRPTTGNAIRRRRRCVKCGHRFSTYEIAGSELEELENLKEMSEKLNQLTSRDMKILRATLDAMTEGD